MNYDFILGFMVGLFVSVVIATISYLIFKLTDDPIAKMERAMKLQEDANNIIEGRRRVRKIFFEK